MKVVLGLVLVGWPLAAMFVAIARADGLRTAVAVSVGATVVTAMVVVGALLLGGVL